MENELSKKSGGSSDGTVTRRELIRYLALGTAAAGTWRGSSANAANEAKAFKAIAYNHISYNVPDYSKSRDFYADLLGMKLVFDDGTQCSLEFGSPVNALYIRKVKTPGDKVNVDHLAFSIEKFDRSAVEAELKRRDLNPKVDGNYAWTIHDPDGFTLQVCAQKGVYPGASRAGSACGVHRTHAAPTVGRRQGPFQGDCRQSRGFARRRSGQEPRLLYWRSRDESDLLPTGGFQR
jgi:catechol 2,3-dioxygenase-like lactoylglutathione lyase family enzyme